MHTSELKAFTIICDSQLRVDNLSSVVVPHLHNPLPVPPYPPPLSPETTNECRAQQQGQHPTQHLFALTENSAINSSVTAAAGGGGDKNDHGTFGGGGREETKTGDVAAVPPRQGPSGGQPI